SLLHGIKSLLVRSTMALIPSSQLKLKHGLIPLLDKLDEDNFSTWRKLVLLTIQTLKLENHLDPLKTPAQFEEITTTEEKDSSSDTTNPNPQPLFKNRRSMQNGLSMIPPS
ncbi:hypothetical protein PIB30_090376, partial [Stylosanthes scabra]|nr:hypothetical protein [Stylosanthes scabra]